MPPGLHTFFDQEAFRAWGQKITERATRCRFVSTLQLGSTDTIPTRFECLYPHDHILHTLDNNELK